MKCKIIVCCHKDDVRVSREPYLPIHVGKALGSRDIGIIGDDTGDNISVKNKSYCELTGLYWAWKNLKDTEIIGLCHYRRYFDFHHQSRIILPYTKFRKETFEKLDFSVPEELLKEVAKGKIVAPRVMNNVGSLWDEYCICHNSDDLRTLDTIVKEKSDKAYYEAFYRVMHLSHKPLCYNMFVMNWNDFDRYCNWLFDILGEVEKRIDISHYNEVQKRVFGYMAERLFNVYVVAEHKAIIHKPVMFIMDEKNNSRRNYALKSVLNDITFFLSTLYLRLA